MRGVRKGVAAASAPFQIRQESFTKPTRRVARAGQAVLA
ncbi:hypothetical protein OH687_27655 [Burkholderia anthina]|jgi:hypothetical protein|nr:hypothetical protein OH687_27655 [Burkholderia anthina]